MSQKLIDAAIKIEFEGIEFALKQLDEQDKWFKKYILPIILKPNKIPIFRACKALSKESINSSPKRK